VLSSFAEYTIERLRDELRRVILGRLRGARAVAA
jgi:hypothetical protein